MFDQWIIGAGVLVPLAALAALSGAVAFAMGFSQLVWERDELEPGGEWIAWGEVLLGLALEGMILALVATMRPFG